MSKLKINEIDSEKRVLAAASVYPSTADTEPLPEDFGRNLDTYAKVYQWLTNPHNWHQSEIHVVKWNGVLCTINHRHGRALIDNPADNIILGVIVREQRRLKGGGKVEKEVEEE